MNKLFFLFSCIMISWPTYGQKSAVVEEQKTWEEKLIEGNKEISAWFDGVTEGIDLFLVGKRVTKEKNKSSIRIDNTTTVTEAENFLNTTSISIKPRLQNLEEFLQLKFETYDENETGRGIESTYLRKTQRRKNYGATLGFFRKLGRVRTTFQPRIELQDPLKVSHTLGFESVAEVKNFSLNPKLEFFADANKGIGTFQAVNLNYEFNPVWRITLINEGEYQEKLHKLFVTNGFALSQEYSEKTSFIYGWLFHSDNRESYHLYEHIVSVTWRQNIYRNILDFQLQPYWDFAKVNRFKGKSGVIFNISINF